MLPTRALSTARVQGSTQGQQPADPAQRQQGVGLVELGHGLEVERFEPLLLPDASLLQQAVADHQPARPRRQLADAGHHLCQLFITVIAA